MSMKFQKASYLTGAGEEGVTQALVFCIEAGDRPYMRLNPSASLRGFSESVTL